jgi:hypothetical protein
VLSHLRNDTRDKKSVTRVVYIQLSEILLFFEEAEEVNFFFTKRRTKKEKKEKGKKEKRKKKAQNLMKNDRTNSSHKI